MKPLTTRAHEWVAKIVAPGDCVIDATAGNGHDTLFLARQVGSSGRVLVFDVQQQALRHTVERIPDSLRTAVIPIHDSHAHLGKYVSGQDYGHVSAVLFNLGYLPGGDKTITTQSDSTLSALRESLEVLKPGGILSVIAYTGHPGGAREAEQVGDWFGSQSQLWLLESVVASEAIAASAPLLYLGIKRGKGSLGA